MGNNKQSGNKPLVVGSLNRIPKNVFAKYPRQLTELIGNEAGVYALYRKNNLYYVGLASKLKSRLTQHLKDRHADEWDSFSLYLVNDAGHLKDMETLILHIANPPANRTKGKFIRDKNLLKQLTDAIKIMQRGELDDIHGKPQERLASKNKTVKAKGLKLRATFKGKNYNAVLRADGKIIYGGEIYTSSSGAGVAVTGGKSCRGPKFWQYKNEREQWVPISELPKQVAEPAVGKTKTASRPTIKNGKGAELYSQLKPWLHGLGDDVQEKILAGCDVYKCCNISRPKSFASVLVSKARLKIYVPLNPSEEEIIEDFTRDMRGIGHHGNGDLEITVGDGEQLGMAKSIIQRSYDAQVGLARGSPPA